MNNILSIIVDAALQHSTREKIAQQLVLKMCRNEQDLQHSIINGCPIFETLRKKHGYENVTRLSRGLCLKGGNGMPVAHLIMDNVTVYTYSIKTLYRQSHPVASSYQFSIVVRNKLIIKINSQHPVILVINEFLFVIIVPNSINVISIGIIHLRLSYPP